MLRMLHKSITRGLCCLAALIGLSSLSSAGRIERITDPATGKEKTVIHIALHDWIWEELDPVRTETAIRANAAAVKDFTRTFPEMFAQDFRQTFQYSHTAKPDTHAGFSNIRSVCA